VARAGQLVFATSVALWVLAGCSVPSPGDGGEPDVGGDGPLRALAGEGAAIGPAVKNGRATKTVTFATQLCSEDTDAEIVIDAVRYDAVPDLPEWQPGQDVPSIGTRLRSIPPPGDDGKEISTIGAINGGPEKLRGQITEVGEEPSIVIPQPCERRLRLSDDRTWPIPEVLTVMTVGSEGGLVRRTHLDYHVGDDEYTITWKWKVGLCGTAVPAGNGCGKPKR
jgi:hypothetical protein